MESQSAPLSKNTYTVKKMDSESIKSHFASDPETRLHDDWRWLSLVSKYANASIVELGVFKGEECIMYIRGNRFSRSRFGTKALVIGGFLDYGEFSAIRTDEKLNLNFISSLIATNLKIKKIITKEIVKNSDSSQSLAIINLKDLTEDMFLAQISSRARNDIRRAVESKVKIEFNHNFIYEFYELYSRRMHQFGTPPHPLIFFKEIISNFGENMYVGVARIGDRVIYASLGITINKNTYHLFASSDSKYKPNSAGDLLLFEEIKRSIGAGVEKFWLGRSLKGSGVEFYKSKWNPEFFDTKEIIWDFLGSNYHADQSGRQNSVARIFRKLPFPIFKLIGTRLRRFIP